MSFYEEGFTGASEASLREGQFEKYAELLTFAKACSKHAVEISQLLPESKGETELTACLFFARSTSQFQAAMCLAERGMTIEAMVLCRSLLETFFVLNAIAEGVVTPAELVSHDGASRRSHANALLQRKNTYENVAPFENKLREFVAEKTGSIEIKLFEFASKCNALATYDGLYRHLSHHAAHPSLSAVDPYLVDTPDNKTQVLFRAVLEYTPRAVLSACIGILMSCFACDKLGIRTPKTNMVGAQLWLDYQVLYEANDPWN